MRRSGSTSKSLMTWTGPWRVLVAQRSYVYGVQNIVSGEVRDVHVARMRFHADGALEITAELKELFQHALSQEEFEMAAAIVDLATVEEGSGFEVEVMWAAFDTERNTWEDLANVWGGAPQFVKELRKMRLKQEVRTKLKRQCGIAL